MPAAHSLSPLDVDLGRLHTRVMEMGEKVDCQFLQALQGLGSGDGAMLAQVIADDSKIDALEEAIDQECLRLISCYQPVADDLRVITTVVHTITDLERIGDEAVNIARRSMDVYQAAHRDLSNLLRIRHAASMARTMLSLALDAFERLDARISKDIARQGHDLRGDLRALTRRLATDMVGQPRIISSSVALLFVTTAIERIGEHAQDIAHGVALLIGRAEIAIHRLPPLQRQTG
ncbi:MAG TPA: phosphate transport system regulatory protein PhoU [Betaproteobacteria bacterium]|nr:phosphate transport system regulatory protein PhoU [Betaproteobacteria bacterium]